MATVPSGDVARIFVPRGVYQLGSVINQPIGRSITVEFDEGSSLAGAGYLGVDRVESHQGPFRLSQISGGYSNYATGVGSPTNPAFDYQIIQNTPTNSGSARVAWSRYYASHNRYSKYAGGLDGAEQNIYAWPNLVDNTGALAHWDVIIGATYDEDTAARGQLGSSTDHSEYDVVNNGPEAGWTFMSGVGTTVQGMSMDPWGQNGIYGGHILYAYGTVGSYDGVNGGINQRWISYPAAYSSGNPPAVAKASTLTITMDVTAKATAFLQVGGAIGAIAVTSGGGAYTTVPSVVFSGGNGSGAAATAVLVGGAVVSVTLTHAGSGYTTAPVVTFVGGGAPAPVAVPIALNGDGAHGDIASIATAINAANIPYVGAAISRWGGAVASLVIFGTAPDDVGTLTLGGTAIATLGMAAAAYTTPRDDTAVAFGGGSATPGDKLSINGTTITIGGSGSVADVVAAVKQAGLPGLGADVTANGRLALTAWLPQQPGGLFLAQPAGYTTLQKLSLSAGTILPPTPPKAFATAHGEIGASACKATDVLSIAATDLTGKTYGPVSIQLNGGLGLGSVADVAASIQAALSGAGWFTYTATRLTSPPGVVACFLHGTGATAGLVIRNTAGGTLTLANVTGTPLQTLGLVGGTYQPGGYSAASQTVFHAAPNAIAPQGRGVFIGGSSVPDQTIWPHAPAEFRGNFMHGLRTDRASFADGNAVLLGGGQSIGWGVGGPTLSASGNALSASAPLALPSLTLTQLPTSPTGLPAGSVWNNGGLLSIV